MYEIEELDRNGLWMSGESYIVFTTMIFTVENDTNVCCWKQVSMNGPPKS